jgi:PAS fold.
MTTPESPTDSAAQAGHDMQSRMQVLLDASHEAGIGIDDTGLVTDWNRQAELLFGWYRNEVLGRSLAQLLIPERLRAAHHKAWRISTTPAKGRIWIVAWRCRRCIAMAARSRSK